MTLGLRLAEGTGLGWPGASLGGWEGLSRPPDGPKIQRTQGLEGGQKNIYLMLYTTTLYTTTLYTTCTTYNTTYFITPQ